MSIASAIQAKQQQVADSYTAVSNKGGTLPATQNLTNLATAISSIPSGGGGGYSELPSYQVENGIVSKRSGALTGNEFSGITSIDAYGLYHAFDNNTNLAGNAEFSSLTSVGDYGMQSAFSDCKLTTVSFPLLTSIGASGLNSAFSSNSLTTVSFPSLTSIEKKYALNSTFYYNSSLTTVDLSSLTSVGDYGMQSTFNKCLSLTTVYLSSLTSIGVSGMQSAFSDCMRLRDVYLSSLTSIGASGLKNAFSYCTKYLTSVSFPLLTSIGASGLDSAFSYSTQIQHIYFNALTSASFGSYKNQFKNMMSNTGNKKVHRLHFPSNLESTISGLTGYPLFGGTSGKVVLSFDLPATS